MEEKSSRRIATLIIILSLAWNAMIVVLFLCVQDDIHLQMPFTVSIEQEEHQEEQKKDCTYLVEQLISHGTSPVATTILPQQPSPFAVSSPIQVANQIQPTEPLQQEDNSDLSNPTQEQEPQTEPNEVMQALEKLAQSEDPMSEEENMQEELTEEHNEEVIEEPEQTKDEFIQEDNVEQIEEAFETITDMEATTVQELPEHKELVEEKIEPKKISKPTRLLHNPKQKTTTEKRSLSLADIARGYMRHVAQEQENTVETQLRSLPTSKQMALQVYATKIFGLLEQAAKVNRKMLYAPENRTADAILILTIDQSGALVEASLTPPLHEKEIREWLFSFIDKVGLFPPIPKHLKKEKITLNFPLKIDMHQGFGTYSLYYGFSNRY